MLTGLCISSECKQLINSLCSRIRRLCVLEILNSNIVHDWWNSCDWNDPTKLTILVHTCEYLREQQRIEIYAEDFLNQWGLSYLINLWKVKVYENLSSVREPFEHEARQLQNLIGQLKTKRFSEFLPDKETEPDDLNITTNGENWRKGFYCKNRKDINQEIEIEIDDDDKMDKEDEGEESEEQENENDISESSKPKILLEIFKQNKEEKNALMAKYNAIKRNNKFKIQWIGDKGFKINDVKHVNDNLLNQIIQFSQEKQYKCLILDENSNWSEFYDKQSFYFLVLSKYESKIPEEIDLHDDLTITKLDMDRYIIHPTKIDGKFISTLFRGGHLYEKCSKFWKDGKIQAVTKTMPKMDINICHWRKVQSSLRSKAINEWKKHKCTNFGKIQIS